MQTIDLADTVRLEAASSIEIEVVGEAVRGVPLEGPRNLAFGAAHALAEAARNTRSRSAHRAGEADSGGHGAGWWQH